MNEQYSRIRFENSATRISINTDDKIITKYTQAKYWETPRKVYCAILF